MAQGSGGVFGHSARHAVQLGVQVGLSAALFALLLVLAERHNHRFDLTPTKSYVLSDESDGIVRGLTAPVHITAFYNTQEHGQRRDMEDLLGLFAAASPQITYRVVDLDRSPAMAKKYNITSFNTGVIETQGQSLELKSIDEEEIVNALLRLTRVQRRTLCFITAHGEHSPQDAGDRTGYSEVAKALERENFEIKTLGAIPPEGVPADCTIVIFAGPRQDLLPGESEQLARYLDRGGRAILMVDPDTAASIAQSLTQYGVRVGNDIVVDERNRFYGADSFMPRVPIFDEGTFKKNLDTAAVFSLARTVSPLDDAPPGIKVLLLALTSQESWAHMGGTVPEGAVKFDRDKDKPGPLPVGVLVVDGRGGPEGGAAAGPPGRLIVFGDSDFASNLYLNLLGNKDLFMSSVAALAEDQALIAVRRKGLPRSSLSPIYLTAEQGRLIFWATVIVAPGSFTVLGVVITWRRRRRASAS